MKICPQCQYENPIQAKFCMACGTKLHMPKSQLTTATGEVPKAKLDHKPKRAPERRQLTILFCDLVGSTSLSEKLDPEDYRQVILGYQQVAEKVVQRYEGYIAQYLGDGLLVYFGYPKGLEDAPRAGVRTGLGILEAVAHANQEWEQAGKTTIKVRIGIHTGLVVVDDHLALGKTTNIAARLEGLAPHNSLVISAHTYKLVQGWFEVESIGEQVLKGISQPMEVFRVLHESGAKSRLDATKDKGLSPLVGREKELQLLTERWEQAKIEKGNLVLLHGEAGIGKSRLVYTLESQIAEEPNSWLTEIRCSSYHQTSAFYPILEFLEKVVLQFEEKDLPEDKIRKLAGFLLQVGMDLEKDLPLFADFLSIPPGQYTPPAISPLAKKMRLIEKLSQALLNRAKTQPVLLVIEDLHWADASTLEWLNSFFPQIPLQAIFILCTTRPGFQADWMDQAHSTQVPLERLTLEEITHICHHQTKGKALPQEILDQIKQKTEGVPLFVEELSKMILESDLLDEQESRFEVKGVIPPLAIPSTLQDSLLARLDRLSPVKEVVQLGSVLGREFSLELLQAILSRSKQALQISLSQLVDAELLYPINLGNKQLYQFKHALIQDAAYESMLKSHRYQLHHRVAQVLEEQFTEIGQNQPELVAHHYTEAGLPLKALPLWLNAGRLASQKHAIAEAIAHLEKGMKLLAYMEEDAERKSLELDYVLTLGGAFIVYLGYTDPKVGETFNQAKEIAQSIEVSPKLALILYNLQTYYMLSEEHDTSDELVEYELELGKGGEDRYLFRLIGAASKGVSNVLLGNDFTIANQSLKRAVEIYDPSIPIPFEYTPGGDVKINAASWLSISLHMSGYIDQAREISEQHLAEAKQYEDSRTLYHIYVWIGWRLLEAREWEKAAKILKAYLPIAEEFGDPFFIGVAYNYYYYALGNLGDINALTRSEELIKTAIGMGAKTIYSHGSSLLSEAYYCCGQYQKGLAWAKECLAHLNETGSHMRTAEVYRVQGKCLKALGKSDSVVEEKLIKAWELARKQSAKTFELRAAGDLARLWHDQGKTKEAHSLLKGVYDWFTEGFDSIDLREARTLLEELAVN